MALAIIALLLKTLSQSARLSAQSAAVGNCKPISERTTEVGCWIIAHQPVGQLTAQTFWYLDVYPTLSAAESAKGPHGTVVEAMGKTWLLTIEGSEWRRPGGERIARIWTASDCRGRRVLRTIYGGDPKSGDDVIHPQSRGPGGWDTLLERHVWRLRKVSMWDAPASR